MTQRKWYKWPQGYYRKTWKPWYGILRAVLAMPFVYVGVAVMYFGVVLMDGIVEAEHWREELF